MPVLSNGTKSQRSEADLFLNYKAETRSCPIFFFKRNKSGKELYTLFRYVLHIYNTINMFVSEYRFWFMTTTLRSICLCQNIQRPFISKKKIIHTTRVTHTFYFFEHFFPWFSLLSLSIFNVVKLYMIQCNTIIIKQNIYNNNIWIIYI